MITTPEQLAEVAAKATRFIENAKQAQAMKLGPAYAPLDPQAGPTPQRRTSAAPLCVAIYALKGGVGKTALAVHVAHYLSQRQYRVLLADYDPQGSATAYHKLAPNALTTHATASRDFLIGKETSLHTAVVQTQLPKLDLIPATLTLHDCDIALAIELARGSESGLIRLKHGFTEIGPQYDLILIDCPPALASLSLAILASANALIVPLRPSMPDCASTAHLLRLISEYARTYPAAFGPYSLIKLICNGGGTNTDSTDTLVRELLVDIFEDAICSAYMPDSAEIVAAGMNLESVYERGRPTRGSKTYQRCKHYLDQVCAEIEHHLFGSAT